MSLAEYGRLFETRLAWRQGKRWAEQELARQVSEFPQPSVQSQKQVQVFWYLRSLKKLSPAATRVFQGDSVSIQNVSQDPNGVRQEWRRRGQNLAMVSLRLSWTMPLSAGWVTAHAHGLPSSIFQDATQLPT